MPYKNIEDRRRVSRESMRRKHGFKPRPVVGKRESEGNLTPTLTPGQDKREFNPWKPFGDVYPWLRPWHNKGQRYLLEYLGLTDDDLVEGVRIVHTATGEYKDLGGLLDRLALVEERIIQLTWQVADLQADAIQPLDAEEQEALQCGRGAALEEG